MSDMPRMSDLEEDVLMLLIEERKKTAAWESERQQLYAANAKLLKMDRAFRAMLPILDSWLRVLPSAARGMASESLTKELIDAIGVIHSIHKEDGDA